MPGNTFGELFRVTTAGVSHGPGYLAIIEAEKRWLKANPAAHDIYTMRKLPDAAKCDTRVRDVLVRSRSTT